MSAQGADPKGGKFSGAVIDQKVYKLLKTAVLPLGETLQDRQNQVTPHNAEISELQVAQLGFTKYYSCFQNIVHFLIEWCYSIPVYLCLALRPCRSLLRFTPTPHLHLSVTMTMTLALGIHDCTIPVSSPPYSDGFQDPVRSV